MVKNKHPHLLFLMETKVSNSRLQKLRLVLGYFIWTQWVEVEALLFCGRSFAWLNL
jgi:hypothetical protein